MHVIGVIVPVSAFLTILITTISFQIAVAQPLPLPESPFKPDPYLGLTEEDKQRKIQEQQENALLRQQQNWTTNDDPYLAIENDEL